MLGVRDSSKTYEKVVSYEVVPKSDLNVRQFRSMLRILAYIKNIENLRSPFTLIRLPKIINTIMYYWRGRKGTCPSQFKLQCPEIRIISLVYS